MITNTDIAYLKGVGPKRAELLDKELNIRTFIDLLYFFPYRYIDRSQIFKISQIHGTNAYIQLVGVFNTFRTIGVGRKARYVGSFSDESGTVDVIWFKGIKWIKDKIVPGKKYLLFGKPGIYNKKINFIHPEIEEYSDKQGDKIEIKLQPFYSSTEKLRNNYLSSKGIQALQQQLLNKIQNQIEESLPEYLIKHLKLIGLKEALINIHFPQSQKLLEKAQYRIKFEELFMIQLRLLFSKKIRKEKSNGLLFSRVGPLLNTFYKDCLPFELTGAQKRVIREMREDCRSGKQMNRLLQGDVGSGKTLVALMMMLLALDNNYQAAMMAPTEILASQHFSTIKKFTDQLGLDVELLTGSSKKAERKRIHENLLSGKLKILIGTHALIEEEVQFNNLGLVIIDEQHRFGVEQRARLWNKSHILPHVIVMTATPIPRTLAMTIYSDLDISVIDEMPPGRKAIKTIHLYDSKRLELFGAIKRQIAAGAQVYVVYPLIKESEKLDYKNLEDGYESMVRAFPAPQYRVSIVHGKMKAADKEIEMQRFVKGETQIMVATTVIEVGVDVPNASVMVIESAERFGLSQLHQLRGRVGRGNKQSFCFLMSSYKLSAESRKRLDIMVQSNDGFEIAEADLKMRGPGDLEGKQQSGVAFDLKLARLGVDSNILQFARKIAAELLDRDPELNKNENTILRKKIESMQLKDFDWSKIS